MIGPNGAGKTTLLSILAGIQPEGRVEAAADLGWVPQRAALYSKLTVEENLTPFARLERCDDLRDTVQRMLDLTGWAIVPAIRWARCPAATASG